MYRSFSSGLLGFPGRSLRDDAPLAVKYGYEGVNFDIAIESAGFSPLEFSDLLEKNKLKNGGFPLPVEFRKSLDVFKADFESLRAYCEFAKKTGTVRSTTYILPYSDALDYKANFAMHKERLSQIAKLLEDSGVFLGLEFLGPPSFRRGRAHEFICGLDGINELLDAIGAPNLGHLLDVWHWDLAGQVFDDFRKIAGGGLVAAAHINDAPKGLSREAQDNYRRDLPGATGTLKIGDFFKGLADLKYGGPVLVEPFSEALKAMGVEGAAKKAKESMDKVWPAGE